MSLRPGNSPQPDSLRMGGALSVAPQRGQLSSDASISAAHQGQVVSTPAGTEAGSGARGGGCTGLEYSTGAAGSGGGGTAGARWTAPPHEVQKLAVSWTWDPQLVQNMYLFRVVMHVHGLDPDASRPGHTGETHISPAEKS